MAVAAGAAATAPAGTVRRVYAVRHGERCDHVSPQWRDTAQLPHDPPLSALGMAQAWDAARFFAALPAAQRAAIRHVFVSPYIRTLQTAYPIALVTGLPLQPEAGFAEWHEEMPLRPPPPHHTHTHHHKPHRKPHHPHANGVAPPDVATNGTAAASASSSTPAVGSADAAAAKQPPLMALPYIRDASPHVSARFAPNPEFVPADAAQLLAQLTSGSGSVIDVQYEPVVAMRDVPWLESEQAMGARVQQTLLALLARPDVAGDIVVVTHASPMQALTHIVHRPAPMPKVEHSRMPHYCNVSLLTVESAPAAAHADTAGLAPVAPTAVGTAPPASAAAGDTKAAAPAVVLDSAGLSSVVNGLRFTLSVEADSAHVRCQATKCVAAAKAPAAPDTAAAATHCSACAARERVYRARAVPCVPYAADTLARTGAFVHHTSGAEEQPPAPAAAAAAAPSAAANGTAGAVAH